MIINQGSRSAGQFIYRGGIRVQKPRPHADSLFFTFEVPVELPPPGPAEVGGVAAADPLLLSWMVAPRLLSRWPLAHFPLPLAAFSPPGCLCACASTAVPFVGVIEGVRGVAAVGVVAGESVVPLLAAGMERDS